MERDARDEAEPDCGAASGRDAAALEPEPFFEASNVFSIAAPVRARLPGPGPGPQNGTGLAPVALAKPQSISMRRSAPALTGLAAATNGDNLRARPGPPRPGAQARHGAACSPSPAGLSPG